MRKLNNSIDGFIIPEWPTNGITQMIENSDRFCEWKMQALYPEEEGLGTSRVRS